jgi:hypothetical protein
MSVDIEKTVEVLETIDGYADLAKLIASDADGDTAIFRRFETLAARNLLYQQSELLELEALQRRYDEEDKADARRTSEWREIRAISRDWTGLVRRAEDTTCAIHDRAKKRRELAQEIRIRLKEYRASPPTKKLRRD